MDGVGENNTWRQQLDAAVSFVDALVAVDPPFWSLWFELHPELLGSATELLVARALEEARDRADLVAPARLSVLGNLLRRNREVGVKQAFSEQTGIYKRLIALLNIPPALLPDVQKYHVYNVGPPGDPERIAGIEELLGRLPKECKALRAFVLGDLGYAYLLTTKGDRERNLHNTIRHFQAALNLIDREDAPLAYAVTMGKLGEAYAKLPDRLNSLHHVTAISYLREALKFIDPAAAPRTYADTQVRLGAAYANIPSSAGDRKSSLSTAIACWRDALDRTSEDVAGPEHDDARRLIAHAEDELRALGGFVVRSEQDQRAASGTESNDDASALQELRAAWEKSDASALQELRAAWENGDESTTRKMLDSLVKRRSPQLPGLIKLDDALAGLSVFYGNAAAQEPLGNKADNVEVAIKHYEDALQVYNKENYPEGWALTQSNLGNAYLFRVRGERAVNLERAIVHYELALQKRSRATDPLGWAETQNNLGNAYQHRVYGEKTSNMQAAREHYWLAIEERTRKKAPDKWAETQNNLGNVYQKLMSGNRADNLKRAIACYQRSLEIYTFENYPYEWARSHLNLGMVLTSKYDLSGDEADIQGAISGFNLALKVFKREAFPYDWASAHYHMAIAHAKRAGGATPDSDLRYGAINAAARNLMLAREVWEREVDPALYMMATQALGRLFFYEQRWEEAYNSLSDAISASDLLFEISDTEVGRQDELSKTVELYPSAAYCLLKLGRTDEAILTVERGKTRLLIEALALMDAEVGMLSVEQRQAFEHGRRTIRELQTQLRIHPGSSTDPRKLDTAHLLHQAYDDLRNTIAAIRSNYPEFMPEAMDLPQLLGLVPPGGALVVPIVTRMGGAVFVLPPGINSVTSEHLVWLPNLDSNSVGELLLGPSTNSTTGGWIGSYLAFRNGMRNSPDQDWLDAISEVTRRLWDLLMGPVSERLSLLGVGHGAQVILLPQGRLGLLPLHAAWSEIGGKRHSFIDSYVVSYAPSARTLLASTARLQQQQRHIRKLFVIADPSSDLPFARIESEAVADYYSPDSRCLLTGKDALPERLLADAPGYSDLHFSCHGFYDWAEVLNSGLRLAGGKTLTLSEILGALNLHSCRIVTLSACETGLIELQDTPDEYIGLPAGFLQAGAPGVVSSLWPVSDLSTALLMKEFYRLLLAPGQAWHPAMALREAQHWLRGATAEDLDLPGIWRQIAESLPGHEKAQAFQAYRYFQRNPKCQPFEHPYHWAGFTYSGT